MARSLIAIQKGALIDSFGALKVTGSSGTPSITLTRMGVGRAGLTRSIVQAMLGASLIAGFTTAANATCPVYTLTNGSTADATQVMANFNCILNGPTFTGNVGIGATSPSTALDVNGAFTLRGMSTPALSASGQGTIYFDTTSHTFQVSQNGSAYTALLASGGSSQWVTGTNLVYYNTGSVGIGTTSPSTALDVNGVFTLRGTSAPAVSASGQGTIYFDATSRTFQVSQNGGAYAALVGGSSGGTSQWTTNGSNIYYNGGNVGIGTTNPLSTLDVRSSSTGMAAFDIARVSNPAVKAFWISLDQSENIDVKTTNASINFSTVWSGPSPPGSTLFLNFDGRVGVGTTSPTQALHVVGNIYATGNITCGGTCGGGGGTSQWTTTGSDIYFSTGKVGIGTTNPTGMLELKGNQPFLVLNRNTTGAGRYALQVWSTNGTPQWQAGIDGDTSDTSWSLYDRAGAAYALTVKTGGNVGIGTTNPAAALDIYSTATLPGGWKSNLRLSSTTYPSIRFYASNSDKSSSIGNNNDGSLYFGVNGAGDSYGSTYGMVISANAYVGINTTSPSYVLHVNGTAYAAGAAGALSDVRDKKNIAPLSVTALGVISKLRPVTFYWKTPKDDGMKGRQTGLIAQEVEKVLPTTILTAKDARKSKAIKYDELTAILVKAVQEQQKQIAEQARLAALQTRELRSQSTEILQLKLANKKLEARLANIEHIRLAKK